MKYLFVVFCLSGFWIHAQAIEWMTFGEAIEAQKKNPKKITKKNTNYKKKQKTTKVAQLEL